MSKEEQLPAPKAILLATANPGKLREMRELLGQVLGVDCQWALVGLQDLALGDYVVEENGSSFSENSQIKARAASEASGLASLADDSGLEVDALDGRPGIFSARYAGPEASDAQRNQTLLNELSQVPQERRTARFRCALAFAVPGTQRVDTVEATAEGYIAESPQGVAGFGYDPLFIVASLGKTFAEIDRRQKNEISHRALAVRQIAPAVRRYLS